MERTPLLGEAGSQAPARRRGAWVAVAAVAAAGAACLIFSGGLGGGRGGRASLLQSGRAPSVLQARKMGTRDARAALDAYFDQEGVVEKEQHSAAEDAAKAKRGTKLNHEDAHTWRFEDRDKKEGEEEDAEEEGKVKEEEKFAQSFDEMMTRRMNHADKVKIGFFMESECPGCRLYSRKVLAELMKEPEFNNMVEVSVYPFGNGKLTGDEIACQHGPEECVGNKVIACMQKYKRITDTDKMGFLPGLKCLMESEQPPELVFPHCTAQGGIEYEPVRDCVYGEEGKRLVLEAARATESLVPALEYSPWITINGKPCRDAAWDLFPTVCKEYGGPKGRICQAVLAKKDGKEGAGAEGAAGGDEKAEKEAGKGEHAVLQQHRQMGAEGFTVCEKGTGAEVPMPA